MKESGLLDRLRRRTPGVIRTIAALASGELFRRPKPSPGVPLVYDHRDRGPNAHLSEEARKAGVTIPEGWRRTGPRSGRLW
jgi:hypothetical protein